MLDGQPFRFVGTNNYYQMIHRARAETEKDFDEVNEVLDEMECRGMTVLRTWAFQDDVEKPNCVQCAPKRQLDSTEEPTAFIGETGEDTLEGLDNLLASCAERNIKVILTLVNGQDDFGGISRYALWRYGCGGEDGPCPTRLDDCNECPDCCMQYDAFYSDEVIKGWFRDYVSVIVNRYRDDPTILAWELANEPRTALPANAGHLDAWICEMSAFIKSLDPNHLVTTGLEGFFGPGHDECDEDGFEWMCDTGTDFTQNHRHEAIDFAVMHVWPQNWGWDPIADTEDAREVALERSRDFVSNRLGVLDKPVVIEEFGIPRDGDPMCAGLSDSATTTRDHFYHEVFYGLCDSNASCGGALNWMIADTASALDDDCNFVFLPEDTCTDVVISAHANGQGHLLTDTDDDGMFDTCDPCPSDLSNSCDPDGSGAVQCLADSGCCLETPNGALEICADPGDLPEDVTISATQAGVNDPDVDLLIGGTPGLGTAIALYDLEPDGMQFDSPVTLTIEEDVSNLNHYQRSNLKIYVFNEDTHQFEWVADCSVSPNPSPPNACSPACIATCTAELNHFSRYGLIAPRDTDDDGVPDDFAGITDGCTDSDSSPNILIHVCETDVTNALFEEGCSMADLIASCSVGDETHSDFVSCVAHVSNGWAAEGLISGQEKGAIQSCAAQPFPCETDADCFSDQTCQDGQCIGPDEEDDEENESEDGTNEKSAGQAGSVGFDKDDTSLIPANGCGILGISNLCMAMLSLFVLALMKTHVRTRREK